MRDVYFATAAVGAVSVVCLALGGQVGKRVSRRTATWLCVATVAFILAHVRLVSDRLWVTGVLPVAAVPVLGDMLLPAVAALAGLAWRAIPGGVTRRGVLLVPLLAIGAHRALQPALATPPAGLGDRWSAGVCLQTSPATCGPAAAATLLRAHGIGATEAEMARLCLTTDRGTRDQGVYRGLKLKTAPTHWDVESFKTDAAGLRRMTGPAVLFVRLDDADGVDPRYETLWGWQAGVSHTIVFYGFAEGGAKVEIGDPAVGREQWSARDLGVLWHGEGLRLFVRD